MDKANAIRIMRQLAAKYKGLPAEHDAINAAIKFLEELELPTPCTGDCKHE